MVAPDGDLMKKIALIISFLLGIFVCLIAHYFFSDRCIIFPHVSKKYNYQALFTPKQHLERLKTRGKFACDAPKTLIVCCDDGLLKNVAEQYHTQACEGYTGTIYFLTDYPSVALTKFGLTSPLNAMGLDLVIAWGVKQVIFIGTACSLQKNLSCGDLIVVERSIRDEGTSYHYLPYSKYVYPSEKLTDKLLLALKNMNMPYTFGTIWTTDGFYRETEPEIVQYQKEGVLGVEMETAGLFSVAAFNHIDIVALLTVTDSFANLKYEKAVDYKEKKLKTLENFFEIALKIAS